MTIYMCVCVADDIEILKCSNQPENLYREA